MDCLPKLATVRARGPPAGEHVWAGVSSISLGFVSCAGCADTVVLPAGNPASVCAGLRQSSQPWCRRQLPRAATSDGGSGAGMSLAVGTPTRGQGAVRPNVVTALGSRTTSEMHPCAAPPPPPHLLPRAQVAESVLVFGCGQVPLDLIQADARALCAQISTHLATANKAAADAGSQGDGASAASMEVQLMQQRGPVGVGSLGTWDYPSATQGQADTCFRTPTLPARSTSRAGHNRARVRFTDVSEATWGLQQLCWRSRRILRVCSL